MPIITKALTLEDLPPPPLGKTGWPWTEQSEPLPDRMPNVYEWSRISIVTPNYNYGHFLEETIRSVLLQGYPNLEYIITDGGSTDGSLEVIEKYAQWLAYYVSEKDKGQSDAINKGFQKATGEIYAWLNSDDVFCQNTLLEIGLFWSNNTNCHFLTGDGYFFSIENCSEKIEYYVKAQNYSLQDLFEYHHDKYLPQPSVFFSQHIFHQLNGLDVSLSYAMDLDYWLRIRKLYPLHYLPKCFSKLRHHTDAKTWKSNLIAMAEVKEVIEKYDRHLKLFSRFRNKLSLRLFYASAMLKHGLFEYSIGNKIESIKWWCKSALFCPSIIGFANYWKLIIKILFI
ncbi:MULTISPECIES: glycosyltransferase family 2 protein [Nostocales]|uniref:Glycosyltransferase n=3 Tax=Nostocales TaxID=1161 RepID=A0A8S9TAT6_9CYAN|nr:glycosyltransferase family 2 protein [Tolypothrix bouteillei]KAF3889681.1 glycosyltransferase [Tolypothrix bouteillei VB521301]